MELFELENELKALTKSVRIGWGYNLKYIIEPTRPTVVRIKIMGKKLYVSHGVVPETISSAGALGDMMVRLCLQVRDAEKKMHSDETPIYESSSPYTEYSIDKFVDWKTEPRKEYEEEKLHESPKIVSERRLLSNYGKY